MPTASVNVSASIAGLSFSGSTNKTGASQIGHEVVLDPAKAGVLTTRTDNDTGAVTLSNGHGITQGMVVDLYWDGGYRKNVDVGVVSTNVVQIDGGAGDNLPIATTAITLCQQTVIDSDFDGTLVLTFATCASKRSVVDFKKNDNTSIYSVLIPAGGMWYWSYGNSANPLDDTVGKISVSHDDASNPCTVKIGVLYSGA